ncbi:MAG: YbhB/YbcL family Raf kinase inhibitor-like protein [Acidimicrobiia bacterium]
MWLRSDDFSDGEPIPGDNAFNVIDPDDHARFGGNKNPHLVWGDAPENVRSFALLVIDVDVPTSPDDVNQEGREVPADLPRADFTHWALVDIDAGTRSLERGAYSDGVTPKGKSGRSDRPREGVNDYTGWFSGDPEMGGTYKGYDGPCPPWNDSIIHHYVFTLYALDVDSLGLSADFSAADVRSAMEGHILDSARLIGTCTLNPRLAG